jgi:chemotaxis regulatin CheY-phosphate phosphatase CheZ
MKDNLVRKISGIVEEQLSGQEVEEVISFLKQSMVGDTGFDDDLFFRNLAYEMTGQVKELALLIIDFRKNLKSKIPADIADMATKYIPQAADQLETIIESTAKAADKIMDNLESMQESTAKLGKIVSSLEQGKALVPNGGNGSVEVALDSQVLQNISPLIEYIKSNNECYMSLISDTFIQMSFQDLTGQRINRIMKLVSQLEEKLRNMIISFGIKLTEKDKNPNISKEDLEKAVEEKITELAGPQKEGHGLDQAGIDDLLASI